MRLNVKNCYAAVNEEFYFIEGNREVRDEKHVRSIMNAMMNGEFIPPIIVDSATKLVIDGQHRYTAALNLWKQKIGYQLLVIEAHFDNPLLAAIKYNNRAKNWRTSTFVNAYIADGRDSYKLLKEFCLTHKLLHLGEICKYSSAIPVLGHRYDTVVVQNGTLVITAEQCAQAEVVYAELAAMYEIIPMVMQKHVILAWVAVRKNILANRSMDEYLDMLRNKFVTPASGRVAEWKYALAKVLL
jgi:hypothetical protein